MILFKKIMYSHLSAFKWYIGLYEGKYTMWSTEVKYYLPICYGTTSGTQVLWCGGRIYCFYPLRATYFQNGRQAIYIEKNVNYCCRSILYIIHRSVQGQNKNTNVNKVLYIFSFSGATLSFEYLGTPAAEIKHILSYITQSSCDMFYGRLWI